MKKYILLTLSFFCLTGFEGKEPFNERIIVTDNMQTYYNFPSSHLNYRRNIRFVLPADYNTSNTHYQTIYLFEDILSVEHFKEGFIYIIVEPKEEDKSNLKDFSKFIEEDVVLYTDLNYRTDASPASKRLQAAGARASAALYVWNHTDVFGNLFLYDASDIIIPLPVNQKQNVNVYFESNKESAFFLDEYFTAQGLKYGQNLLYKFEGQRFECAALFCLPNKAKYGLKLTRPQIPLDGGQTPITGIYGEFNFIVKSQDLRISPPVLNFDEVKQILTPISGAPAGKVALSAHGAKTKLKLSAKQAKN